MNDSNSMKYGSYHTLDMKAAWEFSLFSGKSNIRLYVGARNVFNEKYASMILVNAPSFNGSAPRYYYPGRPLDLYFGVKLSV